MGIRARFRDVARGLLLDRTARDAVSYVESGWSQVVDAGDYVRDTTAAAFGNLAQGLGIRGKDPRRSDFWGPGDHLSDIAVAHLARDAIGAKVVGAPWADAIRPGFEVRNLPEAHQRAVADRWRALDLSDRQYNLNFLGDVWGEAIGVLGTDDFAGLDTDQAAFSTPLRPDAVRGFAWLRVFGRRAGGDATSGFARLELAGPESSRFGAPVTYRVDDFFAPARPGYSDALRGFTGSLDVHWTRTVRSVTRDARSVYVAYDRYLKDFHAALAATRRGLDTWSVSVFKISNWLDATRRDREEARGMLALAAQAMSQLNALIVDREKADHEFQSRSMGGFSDSVVRLFEALAAAVDIPMVRLFGLEPRGFSSGKEVFDSYHTRVADLQTRRLLPQTEILVDVILRSLAASDPSLPYPARDSWQVVYNPPRIPTDKEKAETRLLTAQYLKTFNEAAVVSGGQLTAEEVRSPFSGDQASVDVTLQPLVEAPPSAPTTTPGPGDPEPDVETDEPTVAEVRRKLAGHRLQSAEALAAELGVRKSLIEALGRRRVVSVLPGGAEQGRAAFSREQVLEAVNSMFRPAAGPDADSRVDPPRTFTMVRHGDVHGVSGTGDVADGVVFADGATVTRWLVDGMPHTSTVFASYADFLAVHVANHHGNGTEITFHDGGVPPRPTPVDGPEMRPPPDQIAPSAPLEIDAENDRSPTHPEAAP